MYATTVSQSDAQSRPEGPGGAYGGVDDPRGCQTCADG